MNKEKEEIRFDIKTEHIQALLEGKKLTLDVMGKPRITLIPDRYGVFITYEKLAELKKSLYFSYAKDPSKIFEDIFGEDLTN